MVQIYHTLVSKNVVGENDEWPMVIARPNRIMGQFDAHDLSSTVDEESEKCRKNLLRTFI